MTVYCIYDSIYTISKDENDNISDVEVERIIELFHYIYLKDEYYNFDQSRISDYITCVYLEYKIPLVKFENVK